MPNNLIKTFHDILNQKSFDKNDLMYLLQTEGEELQILFETSRKVRDNYLGNQVYLRGLIEYSNVCAKDCYYCGIRKSNRTAERYILSDDEVLQAALFAWQNRYGSIVLQAGERTDNMFTSRITALVKLIKKTTKGELGITLSLGEQHADIYQEWFAAGAHRYLLRIETSNPELYKSLHPENHNFQNRLNCLQALKNIGYQVGTGVMIGLPHQTIAHLADDLLFLKSMDVDMVGMGPYIEHPQTPLFQLNNILLSKEKRLELTYKMIALLRIMMPDINIASTTALQAITPLGREKGIQIGANVIMPNISPKTQRKHYALYDNKPCTDENPTECNECLEVRLKMTGSEIAYGQWGDAPHYYNKINQSNL